MKGSGSVRNSIVTVGNLRVFPVRAALEAQIENQPSGYIEYDNIRF